MSVSQQESERLMGTGNEKSISPGNDVINHAESAENIDGVAMQHDSPVDFDEDLTKTLVSDENENTVTTKSYNNIPSPSKVSFELGANDNNFFDEKTPRSAAGSAEKATGCVRIKARANRKWGWAVVFATWIVMIPLAGTLASFGTMIDLLTEEFNATKLEAGWLGSLSFSFTVGTCPLSTPLFTVFGGRKVAFVGVVGGAVSLVLTSFAPSIYMMFVTYSAMFGIFTNFVYNSGMSLTGQYFLNKNQALSTCLASAGISFGTLLINPLSEVLVSTVGWRITLRVMAGMVLTVGLLCVSMFKPVKTIEQKLHTKLKRINNDNGRKKLLEVAYESNRNLDVQAVSESLQNCNESKISLAAKEMRKNITDKRMWDCDICRYPATILWMLGTLFWSLSFLFPMIFLISYMSTVGIARSDGAWVLTAYGIAEFTGRILCAVAANRIKFSYAYVYATSAALSGFATLFAPKVGTLTIMYIYSIAIGVNSGILNSMMFVSTMQFFGNTRGPHVWGYINVMLALGMMIGPVTAGGIYDMTQSYITAFYIGGGMFLMCTVTMLLIPVSLKYFPIKNLEARGKREKLEKKASIVKARRPSLRKLTMMNQINEGKKMYNKAVKTDLNELNEIHESEKSLNC